MGVKGLFTLIDNNAPAAKKDKTLADFSGKTIAIDTSCCLYQYLIGYNATEYKSIGHIKGMYDLTKRLLNLNILPIYVFDGKPPELKSGELAKRAEKHEEAQKALDKATKAGDAEEMDKFNRRLVRVTKQHNAEAKELLALMGVPYIDAPSEAEAQCAVLAKAGKVYGVATNDSDALAYGTTILIRNLTHTKKQIEEISMEKLRNDLKFSQEEFIDLCVLLGTDYCATIRNIGQKGAVALMAQHRTIEQILKNIDKTIYVVPEDWKYQEARLLFMKPEVVDPEELDLKRKDPDVEELVKFLHGHRLYDEERIRADCKTIVEMSNKLVTKKQTQLDHFFKEMPNINNKRKLDASKKKPPAKKAKVAPCRKIASWRREKNEFRASAQSFEAMKEAKIAAFEKKQEIAKNAKAEPYPQSKMNLVGEPLSFAAFSTFFTQVTGTSDKAKRLNLLEAFFKQIIEKHPRDVGDVAASLVVKQSSSHGNTIEVLVSLIAGFTNTSHNKTKQKIQNKGYENVVDNFCWQQSIIEKKALVLSEVAVTIRNMNDIQPKLHQDIKIAKAGQGCFNRCMTVSESKTFCTLVRGLSVEIGFTKKELFHTVASAYCNDKNLQKDMVATISANI